MKTIIRKYIAGLLVFFLLLAPGGCSSRTVQTSLKPAEQAATAWFEQADNGYLRQEGFSLVLIQTAADALNLELPQDPSRLECEISDCLSPYVFQEYSLLDYESGTDAMVLRYEVSGIPVSRMIQLLASLDLMQTAQDWTNSHADEIAEKTGTLDKRQLHEFMLEGIVEEILPSFEQLLQQEKASACQYQVNTVLKEDEWTVLSVQPV